MHADLDAGFPGIATPLFDVCICGTGPAGLTVALELGKAGKRIALVEAGTFDYTEESQNFYAGTETGLIGWNAPGVARLRYFGGTSGHWAGRCGLLDEIDFSADTYHGMPGWPISRKSVLETLAQAVEILDLGGQSLATKPIKNGVDSTWVRSSEAKSAPTRFGQKYRRGIVESPNIQLVSRANLVELRLGAQSRHNAWIEHAVLKNYKGETFKVSAKRYVLALGGIENARLLLNSDKQAPGGIGNHSGYVGRCFMEHLNVPIGRFVVRNMDYFQGKALQLSPGDAVMRSQRMGNGVMAFDPNFVPTEYGRLRYFKRILREGACEFETIREYARKFQDFNCRGEGVISSLLEQCPNPESRVSLRADVDALGLRKINLHWAINDADRRSIRSLGMELAKEVARLDAARIQLSDFMLNKSQPIRAGPHAHHMGTTRMSHDPRHGVVDENCKVHGVSNLYIGGSSVFPTGGGTNPTLTIVMLALRLGKHLIQLA